MNFFKRFIQWIKFRKQLKQIKKKDPYVYK